MRDNIQRAAAGNEQIDGAKELATGGQTPTRLARPLRDRLKLTAIRSKERQDQVGFFELYLIEDDRIYTICLSTGQMLFVRRIPETTDLRGVIAPTRLDLNVELQKHL